MIPKIRNSERRARRMFARTVDDYHAVVPDFLPAIPVFAGTALLKFTLCFCWLTLDRVTSENFSLTNALTDV